MCTLPPTHPLSHLPFPHPSLSTLCLSGRQPNLPQPKSAHLCLGLAELLCSFSVVSVEGGERVGRGEEEAHPAIHRYRVSCCCGRSFVFVHVVDFVVSWSPLKSALANLRSLSDVHVECGV
jgi:hypothetical protein